MKALVCELCGSNEFVKEDGYFVCQHCHTKYSPEEAKKIMVEGTVDVSGSTVKVDSSDRLENLYILARRAREEKNYENAYKYYNEIVIEQPNDWEAAFYSVFYTLIRSKIGEIEYAADRITKTFFTVANIITTNESIENQNDKLYEIANNSIALLKNLATAAFNHYVEFTSVSGAEKECKERTYLCGTMAIKIADYFYEIRNDKRAGAEYYKRANDVLTRYYHLTDEYVNRVREIDPEYQVYKGGGGCYVATAVYGSYDCPEVWTLRRFRDNTLAETWYGRAFIHTYYAISPTLVKWFGKTEWFKNLWKPMLDKMVKDLQEKGVENTPYSDRQW